MGISQYPAVHLGRIDITGTTLVSTSEGSFFCVQRSLVPFNSSNVICERQRSPRTRPHGLKRRPRNEEFE